MISIEKRSVIESNFQFPGQTNFYRGKVRDVYTVGEQLIMVASDRISAFDHILPRPLPYKGQVLNQIAQHFLAATQDIVPNWVRAHPDPNVTLGRACSPFKIEMVIRGYLVGHAWREYAAGKRQLCGVPMPEGLRESEAFPQPIITPATKAEEGHDEDVSREDIIARGLVSEAHYTQLEAYTRALFARGSAMAAERGLILVDTKYEFGMYDGIIYLIDEIHTPDSSRYFYREGYAERLARGERQKHLSKEFVREWLISQGFQGLDGQVMPTMPDAFVESVSERYIVLFEQISGGPFVRAEVGDLLGRIEQNVLNYLANPA